MSELIKSSLFKLKSKKILNPELDLRLLLNNTNKNKKEIILSNLEEKFIDIKTFNAYLERRLNYEPISKIINKKSFWKYDFYVNQDVLDPRPETELILEESLNFVKNKKKYINILDIGTGSGCIIISILKERKRCYGVGIDISKNAVKLAKYNAKIQHIDNRIKFFNSNIDNFYGDKYDLIISNPPYIEKYKINGLEKDIKYHEPKVALDGGIDGFSKIKLIIEKSSTLIKKKGKLFLEIGKNQTSETLKILNLNGFYKTEVIKDLANKNRCIISTKI